MAVWPADDSDEWGEPLKQYIDAGDAGATPPVDEAVALLVGTEGTSTQMAVTAQTVAVRTSDGHSLPPDVWVVLTLDKTLAEITANPTADIADITFEEQS